MSRELRGNICDATKDHGIKCAANIENFTRQKEKGRRKAPSSKKCDAAIKKNREELINGTK
jgi:hypothetical protein